MLAHVRGVDVVPVLQWLPEVAVDDRPEHEEAPDDHREGPLLLLNISQNLKKRRGSYAEFIISLTGFDGNQACSVNLMGKRYPVCSKFTNFLDIDEVCASAPGSRKIAAYDGQNPGSSVSGAKRRFLKCVDCALQPVGRKSSNVENVCIDYFYLYNLVRQYPFKLSSK